MAPISETSWRVLFQTAVWLQLLQTRQKVIIYVINIIIIIINIGFSVNPIRVHLHRDRHQTQHVSPSKLAGCCQSRVLTAKQGFEPEPPEGSSLQHRQNQDNYLVYYMDSLNQFEPIQLDWTFARLSVKLLTSVTHWTQWVVQMIYSGLPAWWRSSLNRLHGAVWCPSGRKWPDWLQMNWQESLKSRWCFFCLIITNPE